LNFGFGLNNANNSASGKPGSSANAELPETTKPKTPQIPSELSGMPGGVPFVQPDVVKKLAITPSQMDGIERLNKITVEAINDLDKYWGSGDRWELAQKRTMLLTEARQQALQVLTDRQRKLWNEMTK
jgi:hypothetical protein